MSWRAESTFKPSSHFAEEEKEFLKLSKKIREVLKLEERARKGDALEELQLTKVAAKEALLKQITALAVKLPPQTECLQRSEDIIDLLPSSTQRSIGSKRHQEQGRREAKEAREAEERNRPEFLDHHNRPIVNVAVSGDGKFLFTCSKDKYVLCWSMQHRLLQSVCTLAGHTGAVWALDASHAAGTRPGRLLSGGADGHILFWDADAAQRKIGSVVSCAASLRHGGVVRVLRWCPFDEGDAASRRFASASEKLGSDPPIIAVWRTTSAGAEKVLQLDNLPSKANDLQWGSGSTLKLFSAHDNGYVGVWSAEAPGRLLKTIPLHSKPVTALCLSADGATLVTASLDATSVAVDVSSRDTATLATYRMNRPLNAVCLSADFRAGAAGLVVLGGGIDSRDVTTSKDARAEDNFDATVLDAASGEAAAAGTGHFGPVHALLPLPALAGARGAFASVSEDGCVRVHGMDGKLLHSDTTQ